MIRSYAELIAHVERVGWLPFSGHGIEGLDSLASLTRGQPWHSEEDGDPWAWKDLAAAENRLAYGSMLGGHKGFVSPRMYACFYAVFHPGDDVEERFEAGLLSRTARDVYRLFDSRVTMPTHGIRQAMGVTKKTGGTRVDAAIAQLHRTFDLTTAGTEQKVDAYGRPYGWPSTVQARVDAYIPAEWLTDASSVSRDRAVERILGAYPDADRGKLCRLLGIAQMC